MKRIYKWGAAALFLGFLLMHLQNQMETVTSAKTSASSAGAAGKTAAPAASKTATAQAQAPAQQASPGQSPGTPSPAPVRNESDFLQRFPGPWTFNRNTRGRIQSFSGALMNVGAKSEADVPALMRMIAPMLDVPAEQMLAAPVTVNGVTGASKTFELKQTVDGIEVFGGIIRVHTRSSDGAVYIVDNLSHPVGGYNKMPSVTQQQAAQIVADKFGAGAEVRFNRGPVLFANGATELAWVFNVMTTPHRQTLLLVVGASSGQILSEQLQTRK